MKTVRTFDLTPPMTNGRFFLPVGVCSAAALAGLLDGDLRHEVAHLPNRRLRFGFVGRFDDVFDLLPGGVHRLELISRHGRRRGLGVSG